MTMFAGGIFRRPFEGFDFMAPPYGAMTSEDGEARARQMAFAQWMQAHSNPQPLMQSAPAPRNLQNAVSAGAGSAPVHAPERRGSVVAADELRQAELEPYPPTRLSSGSPSDAEHRAEPASSSADTSELPRQACRLVAPSGRYHAPDAIPRFQPSFADQLSAGIAILNRQGIEPVLTDGYRSEAMQKQRRRAKASGASPYPAAKGVSSHQVGLSADFGSESNRPNNDAIL